MLYPWPITIPSFTTTAVVVKDGIVIGQGYNKVISKNSVSCHAEILAINEASDLLKNYRLGGCEIYVTLEPCHMCAKAIVDARISNLYFGAPKYRLEILASTIALAHI